MFKHQKSKYNFSSWPSGQEAKVTVGPEDAEEWNRESRWGYSREWH